MKAAKYLFALWAGVLIYVSLSVMFGAKGFSAYRQLEKEQQKQEANIESLIQVNRMLEDTRNSLLYDRDTLTVYAREQGFASQAEKFIRIVGLGGNLKTRTQAGEVITVLEPQFTPDRIIRIISFFTGFSILICMAVFDLMRLLRYR